MRGEHQPLSDVYWSAPPTGVIVESLEHCGRRRELRGHQEAYGRRPSLRNDMETRGDSTDSVEFTGSAVRRPGGPKNSDFGSPVPVGAIEPLA